MLIDGSVVPGIIVRFFLVGQPLHLVKPLGKCLCHEAVVRVQEICVAGLDDPVNGSVAQSKSCF